MGRPPRIQASGAFYHLTTRGNLRQPIYLGDDDFELFLSILADVIEKEAWICHAYCLMDNHYHALVQTPDPNLSHGMQCLNGRYARAFNAKHHRRGHLFERRYDDVLVVRQEHLLEVSRYIVLNPVRARMRDEAANWRWSSYRATVGLEPRPAFLTTTLLLSNFGGVELERQRANYRAFVAAGSRVRTLAGLLAA